MKYCFNMGIWNSVFAVPAEIVDKHLKLAGKEQLKVILWMLRHSGEDFSVADAAKATGIRDENAEEAIDYWVDAGLLSKDGHHLLPASPDPVPASAAELPHSPAAEAAIPAEPAGKPDRPAKKRMARPDGVYVATRIGESPDLRFLMEETENTLGKTLSPALSSSLVQIHEDYGLPVEVIVMMIHYVKGIGKTGTSYIEAVARDWAQNEVFTVEAADAKLRELDEKNLAWKKLESTMGTYHRSPSKNEENAAYKWIYEWHLAQELLGEAYERCVDKTGKLSIAYMNKILEKWHHLGFKTLDEVKTKDEKLSKDSKENKKSYDINELEEMNFFNPLEE